MAQIDALSPGFGTRVEDDSIGAPLYSGYSGPVQMLPNPDFVFPLPEPSLEPVPEIPAMSSRRPQSQSFGARRGSSNSNRRSVNTLPNFSFNPATNDVEGAATTLSPQPTTPTLPSQAHGHRRGGSEFIGGDGRASAVGLMSTSPTKGDGILPAPASGLRPGPPAGRPKHSHRRSGAISCHDLSGIMQPSASSSNSYGSSLPATPLESEMSAWPRHQVNRSLSQPTLQQGAIGDESPVIGGPDSSPKRPPSRARVGFSDKVEYIRPLSTISSETESSMSTIRGHSVSNSLSSVVSIGAPSPPSSRRPKPAQIGLPDSRPSTASAIFESKQADALFGEEISPRTTRPVSIASPTSPTSPFTIASGTPSKKRHFFHMPSRQSGNFDGAIRTSTSEPSLTAAAPASSPPASPTKESIDEDSDEESDKTRSQKRSSRAPRKVKSWVSSLISREPKALESRQKRPPTPPVPALPSETDAALLANFDDDNTVTIVTPTTDHVPAPKVLTDFASWQPRHMSAEPDSRSPVIDLDLAMGPYEAERKANYGGRAALHARRTMHSGAFQSNLQQHRRTESAPALPSFEARSLIGSTNVMAEVFEEEEEDEVQDPSPAESISSADKPLVQVQQGSQATSGAENEDQLNIGIQVVDSAAALGKPLSWNFDDGLGIQAVPEAATPKASESTQPAWPLPAHRLETSPVDNPVEVVEDFEEPRASSLTRSSDSTITPSLHSEVKETQPSITLGLPLPDHSLRTPDTFTDASFSTSNLSYSQNSFDTPRLGTSASSMTDNRTLNSQFGEPVPSLRISTDDVPSLTSSRSTATNGVPQARSLVSPRTPADRTSSVSSIHSTMSERRAKRSSIVSLSRLMGVGGTFTEREHGRSKLNIEQRPQSEHMDLREFSNRKEVKTKKPKRFSKVLQFWKSSKDTSRH